jgi:hypothetical protein
VAPQASVAHRILVVALPATQDTYKIRFMPGYAYAILAAGWLIWMAPFLLAKRNHERPKEVDRRARWGVLLVAVAYPFCGRTAFGQDRSQVGGLGFRSLFLSSRELFPGLLHVLSDDSGESMRA